ncbi:hypothetical protein J3R83DRAFT_2360 [Lanmaoa asiatica]|nr:hypothetical protein J3R83DRAFT_2360 [Lanmaoa asiatica]
MCRPGQTTGFPNLTSTKQVRSSIRFQDPNDDDSQILENWRTKRTIEPQCVDEVMQALSSRQTRATETIFKRTEENRKRHKPLRERRWVQAAPQVSSHRPRALLASFSSPFHSSPSPVAGLGSGCAGYTAYMLATFLPLSEGENAELVLDIELENEGEATSD